MNTGWVGGVGEWVGGGEGIFLSPIPPYDREGEVGSSSLMPSELARLHPRQ